MTRVGKQTWQFDNIPVYVQATATVAGQLESEGPLGQYFDVRFDHDRVDGDTWEHSEQRFFSQAAELAMEKANVAIDEVSHLIGGDLNAQLMGFYLGLRAFPLPALGVYSACASICEGLALAALMVNTGHALNVLVGTSSHTSTAERQFRYPTEYGAQKPATAQRTVSGSGVALIGSNRSPDLQVGGAIRITYATVGRVQDFGITSPWEMGAAMAPAAFDTLAVHLTDASRTYADYDCIATGDLGFIGHDILRDLLEQHGTPAPKSLTDCGMLIYDPAQSEVFSGGSGGACCTIVTFAYLLERLRQGEWKRLLVIATGALVSSVSTQQGDSIPGIAHAIAFEREEEGGA